MTTQTARTWDSQAKQWREPSLVAGLFADAPPPTSDLLRHRVEGPFWELLSAADVTLFVTREYEHLAMALTVRNARPHVSYLQLPHPSGLAVDRKHRRVHLASTRNPNLIFTLEPVRGLTRRDDVSKRDIDGRPLVPTSVRVYPGSTYLHDLALVGGELHANAVGNNAVVAVRPDGSLRRVFWPRCIEGPDGPCFGVNRIQLNSIAAGRSIRDSFFTATAAEMTSRRPGQKNFAVDGRGVVFSGRSREPIATGLTRPHSARLHQRRLWVANSGYGELGVVTRQGYEPVVKLPSWTRGLTFVKNIAFVGTSRVLPRFYRYAPGLEPKTSRCSVVAVDPKRGEVLASLTWPAGNQIFAIDWAPTKWTSGFPFTARRPATSGFAKDLFYAFSIGD